jgi:hypothetical protein
MLPKLLVVDLILVYSQLPMLGIETRSYEFGKDNKTGRYQELRLRFGIVIL